MILLIGLEIGLGINGNSFPYAETRDVPHGSVLMRSGSRWSAIQPVVDLMYYLAAMTEKSGLVATKNYCPATTAVSRVMTLEVCELETAVAGMFGSEFAQRDGRKALFKPLRFKQEVGSTSRLR